MRRIFVLLAALAMLVVMATPVSAAFQDRTELSGANEVPPADPDGHGFARVSFDQSGIVCYDIRVENVDDLTVAHIHVGPAGVNGPIVVDFDVPANGLKNCVAADLEVLVAIRDNPSNYYVNVHSVEFPGGAVRGQLG